MTFRSTQALGGEGADLDVPGELGIKGYTRR